MTASLEEIERRLAASTLQDRFWAKVERLGSTECWPWKGCTVAYGRGFFRISKKPPIMRHASQVAWALKNGRWIRPKEVVCHSCDNPRCCNPDHLWVGSQADNMRDMAAKGRGNGR